MHHSTPARAAARQAAGMVLAGLIVVFSAIIGTIGYPSASSSATTLRDVPRSDVPRGEVPPDAPHGAHHGALGEADGLILDGASVFDDVIPAVANLDPSLLRALRRAARDAADDGIEFQITSGWRSTEYQEQLFREAVFEYGSEEEAARWVATPNTSAHVSGDAVDIGPVEARAWLSEHGAEYGLCQVYRNEPWHFELRPEAAGRRCPRMNADTAHDPRAQR